MKLEAKQRLQASTELNAASISELDTQLISIAKAVSDYVQKDKGSLKPQAAALKRVLSQVLRMLKKAKGLKLEDKDDIYLDCDEGGHDVNADISGVHIKGAGAEFMMSVSVDGNGDPSVDISISIGSKEKTFFFEGKKVQKGMLEQALSWANANWPR